MRRRHLPVMLVLAWFLLRPAGLPPVYDVVAAPGPSASSPPQEDRGPSPDASPGGGTAPEGVSSDWWSAARHRLLEAEYEITWQDGTSLPDLAAAWQAPNRASGFRSYFTAGGLRVIPRGGDAGEIEIVANPALAIPGLETDSRHVSSSRRGAGATPRGDREVADGPEWEWRLSLTGYGRGDRVLPVAVPRLTIRGNRVDYDRDAILEWFENRPGGLKHGFLLEAPPEEVPGWADGGTAGPLPGTADLRRGGVLSPVGGEPRLPGRSFARSGTAPSARGPVHLILELGGALSARDTGGGQSVELLTATGHRVLEYSRLLVIDATGSQLPSWMEIFSEDGVKAIRLAIDDTDAVYPLDVDPLLFSSIWSTQSNQAGAELGASLATAGDVNGDGFSDVVVGAPLFDLGEADEGVAIVFMGSPTGLTPAPAWFVESNQSGAQLGASVSTAGDVNGDGISDLIIGARYTDNGQTDEGQVFVFHGSPSGLSGGSSASPLDADWSAESDQASSYFGYSVSTAGDVNGDGFSDVIVGAYLHDNGQSNEGTAFVFHGSGSGLSGGPSAGPLDADWTAESDQTSSFLGISVGTAGDVNADGFADIIVGAFWYDNVESNEGRAFVFHGSPSGLAGGPHAVPSDAAWTAESNQAGAQMGISVGTAGDVDSDGFADVIVGAYRYDNPEAEEGLALVYHGSPSGLQGGPHASPADAAWQIESNQAGALLGRSVSTAGDIDGDGYADVLVGSPLFDDLATDGGAAFLFLGSAAGLGPLSPWGVVGGNDFTELGAAVATAGDVNGDGFSDALVGAPDLDSGESDEGGAYAFLGSPDLLQGGSLATPPDAGWTAEGNQPASDFGQSVASAGDVNGDGYTDVIVGAPRYDNGELNEGVVFVYPGSASGLSSIPSWTAEGDQSTAVFGAHVAAGGDINGDGFADVIVGAPLHDNGELDEGRAYVFSGSPSGLSAAPIWMVEADQASAELGRNVASAGDVNGDGFSDIIVSAPHYDNGQTDEGAVFLYLGSPLGLSGGLEALLSDADWMAESNQTNALFGLSAGSAGDVNGDGFSDVIVSAPNYDGGQAEEGRVSVFLGGPGGLAGGPHAGPLDAAWSAESNQAGAHMGLSVGSGGDVNGDGFSDVIIGTPHYDNVSNAEGHVSIYVGSPVGLTGGPLAGLPDADWAVEGNQENAWMGFSVGSAGDVNADGFSDVIIGDHFYTSGEIQEGWAFVHLGSPTGPSTPASWSVQSNQASAFLGGSVASAGDVNGDGFSEIIVGSASYDNGESDEGLAALYYGNDGPQLGLRPQQRRFDDSAPIDRMGASDQPDGFRLAVLGRTPYGRGRVKMEWEVKPLGVLFDGTGIQTSTSWTDTGAGGAGLNELVSGLSAATPYHWRLRLRYDPASLPYQPASPWLAGPASGWQETDLRTPAIIDVAVTQFDAPDPVEVGQNVAYTITISNAGPGGAAIMLTSTLSGNLDLVSAVPSQGSCSEESGEAVCSLGDVPAPGVVTVEVTATALASGTGQCDAWISLAGFDPSPEDHSSLEETSIVSSSQGGGGKKKLDRPVFPERPRLDRHD